MTSINITAARQNLFQLVSDVNKGFNPVCIVSNNGDNTVLISEFDLFAIKETNYLKWATPTTQYKSKT